MALSPDEWRLAATAQCGSEGDVVTEQVGNTLPLDAEFVYSVAVKPDGSGL